MCVLSLQTFEMYYLAGNWGSIHLLAKLWQPFCKLPFRGLSQNFGAIILATYFGNLFWHAKLWQLFVKKNGNLFWHAKLWQEKWQLIFWHAKLWQLKFGKKNGNLFRP